MGPRLQARIPPAARRHRLYQQPGPHTDPHRLGHAQGAAGHHQEPAYGEGQPVCLFVQPPQPVLRGAAQALGDFGAAQGDYPLHPRQRGQERHHLLSYAQARGGPGGDAAAQRHQGPPLSCGAGQQDKDGEPGQVPDGGGGRDSGHHSLRHGHRQAGRALRHPLRHTQEP